MRDAFVNSLLSLAQENSKVMLLTADLGYGAFDQFIKRFPKQFLNVGVAEQNMLGVATGLALESYVVYAYSIGNFVTLRCLEQIRNDACYHEANVKIVAVGGGFSYGSLGMSHHATEDVSIMRALPNVSILAPCDAWEAGEATKALFHQKGVGYLRLEKNAALAQTALPAGTFMLGKSRVLRAGTDVTLLATGSIAFEALQAAEVLAKQGVSARVISMHTLKPIDENAIIAAARETQGIVTVEEHTIEGGLGGMVAELCLELGLPVQRFARIGLRNTFSSIVGSQEFLRKKYGMDAAAIVQKVTELFSS